MQGLVRSTCRKQVQISRLPARQVPRCRGGGSQVGRDYLYLLTGIRGESVTDVSQRLLARHDGLRGLLRLDVVELTRVRGLGNVKFARVKAAIGATPAACRPSPPRPRR
jgi:hypothetical protein